MRAKFRCRVGVGRYKIWFVQYKNHYAYGESQLTIKTNVCVCVCVCVWGGGGGGGMFMWFMRTQICIMTWV